MCRPSSILTALTLLAVPITAAAQAPVAVEVDSGEMNESFLTVPDLSDIGDLVTAAGGTGWYRGGTTGPLPTGPNDPRYLVDAASPFNGVSRMLISFNSGTFGCSGAMITRSHLLTAAHCVTDVVGGSTVVASPGDVSASFWDRSTPTPTQYSYTGDQVFVHPSYDATQVVSPFDVAVVKLSTPTDPWIPTYELYTDNPLFQEVHVAGYGSTGNGLTGRIFTNQFDDLFGTGVPVLRHGKTSWEMTRDAGTFYFAGAPVTPILISDFDGAEPAGCYPVWGGCWAAETLAQNNTTCNIWTGILSGAALDAACHQGYGLDEVSIAGGDSGGPAFIFQDGKYKLAAVASFGNIRVVPDQNAPPGTGKFQSAYFGALNGHVAVGAGDNYAFITSNSVVPEPATVLLLFTGLVGVGAVSYRRRGRGGEEA